tara:strand:+ start:238 stop:498 length:261 start_codon:yes stop_codon:yes gene_type:complete
MLRGKAVVAGGGAATKAVVGGGGGTASGGGGAATSARRAAAGCDLRGLSSVLLMHRLTRSTGTGEEGEAAQAEVGETARRELSHRV